MSTDSVGGRSSVKPDACMGVPSDDRVEDTSSKMDEPVEAASSSGCSGMKASSGAIMGKT